MSLPNGSPLKKRHRQDNLASPSSPSSTSSATSSPTKKIKKSKYANAPSSFLSGASSPFSKQINGGASSTTASSSRSAPSSPSHRQHTSTSNGSDTAAWIKEALKNVDQRILESRTALPIASGKEAIVEAVRKHDTVVILGETGSGKTTQIPQFLFEAGFARRAPAQMIGVTQPRRVAATSLARRVAAEMGQPDPALLPNLKGKARTAAGGLVGYSIRFEDRTTRNTRVKFMTDGMVLREMIGDVAASSSNSETANPASLRSNLLLKYSVLIIDEAHERTLRTDEVLGLAKRIQRERKAIRTSWIARGKPSSEPEVTELKIIVMSATLDADRFANFFASPSVALAANRPAGGDLETLAAANGKQQVPILYVKGRQHEVTMFHTDEPAQEWTDAALRTVLQIHVSRPPGDILVFMTGQEEIDTLARSLELYSSELPAWAEAEGKSLPMALMIAPLYAALGPSASAKVFGPTPPRTRKVVLATNIAETSITIPGIVFVVDCGLAKEKVYTPGTAVETLQVQEISQSAARQRSGRAGRERAGECYRLYTQEAFKGLPLAGTPEIVRTDLAAAVLQLCAMGQDPYTFDWLDKPDSTGLQESVLQLIQLGALDLKAIPPLSNGTASKANGKKGPVKATAKLALTAIGSKMAMLPVSPAYSRSLIAAGERGPTVARQVRDLIAILSADRSILVDPSDPEKRDEANRAKSTFVHPTGDHATLLTVLYSYLAESDKARVTSKTRKSDGKVDAKVIEKEAREQLKAWCSNHYVHEKAVKNVLHIRKQLRTICRQQKIVCDDDLGGVSNSSAAEVEDGDESDTSSSSDSVDRSGLFVTRKSTTNTTPLDSEEDTHFTGLRQSLLEGRIANAALKNASAPNTYKRITSASSAGSTFKIHPSSTLHPSKMAREGGNKKMDAILFEELVFTTQTFARTVSVIEPSWLQAFAQRG